MSLLLASLLAARDQPVLAIACDATVPPLLCAQTLKKLALFERPLRVRSVDPASEELPADVLYHVRISTSANGRGELDVSLDVVDASADPPRVRGLTLQANDDETGARVIAWAIKSELEPTLDASLASLSARAARPRVLPQLARAAPPATAPAIVTVAPASQAAPSTAPASLPLAPLPSRRDERFLTAALSLDGGYMGFGQEVLADIALAANMAIAPGLWAAVSARVAFAPALQIGAVALGYTMVSAHARVGWRFLQGRPVTIDVGAEGGVDVHLVRRSGVGTRAGAGGSLGGCARATWWPQRVFGVYLDAALLGSFSRVELVASDVGSRSIVPVIYTLSAGVAVTVY
jgi:hypothetical protein